MGKIAQLILQKFQGRTDCLELAHLNAW